MNRTVLQQLADVRISESKALLDAGQWSGAYYLAGYAIECALKACIAKRTQQYDFPNKDLAQKSYTHKIWDLVKVAELNFDRDADAKANVNLAANWLVVQDWEESSRYQEWTEPDARRLYEAIADANDGVLPWIKGRW
jgi:hypothetical protein